MRTFIALPALLLALLPTLFLPRVAVAGDLSLDNRSAGIVNGLWTEGEPSTVALVVPPGRSFCSGTLVNCDTVVTAAHCVCQGTGPECQPPNDPAPTMQVYLQHGGVVPVREVAVSPNWAVADGGDIAVLKLAHPVTGIQPTPINAVDEIPANDLGAIAGFGVSGDIGGEGAGIKHRTLVSMSPCGGNICYSFDGSVGAPGTDGSACFGDSGGPFFSEAGGNRRLAGVTSGGRSCTPPWEGAYTSVFHNLDWLMSQGAGAPAAACGSLATVGSSDSTVRSKRGYLHLDRNREVYTFEVPAGAALLRTTLNAPQSLQAYLRHGAPPTPDEHDCALASFGGCEVTDPASGTWYLSVSVPPPPPGFPAFFSGSEYQATTTLFFPSGSGLGEGGFPASGTPEEFCSPSLSVLCADASLGDRRFEIRASFSPPRGEASKSAIRNLVVNAQSVGLFWFQRPGNPELLVKILDGCRANGHFWLYSAAATNFGFEITVRDRQTGATKIYTNQKGENAKPVHDRRAFSCS